MPQTMSLKQLDQFLSGARQRVEDVAGELREIQVQFVSAHKVNKNMHDATLNDLSLRAAYDLDTLPADVRRAIDEREPVERKTLQDRWRELADRLVPKAEQATDDLVTRAQRETENMRALNPRLNEQEEKLKADRAQMEAELKRLNAEIKRRSGCLTVFIYFFKIGELDRQRHKLLGRMEENAAALRQVRDEWTKAKTGYSAQETQLEQQWQQANVDAARVREEMDQLRDDDKRDKLARQRAIFYVFDNWKTPLAAGGNPLVDEINKMVHLNVETDSYEEGLGKVAGLIALLGGVSQGMQNIGQSVDALAKEQERHSAYLKPVSFSVGDDVIQFHKQWDDLRGKVKDEKTLGHNPLQFSALFDAEVKGPLSEASIKRMFDSLSGSLNAATKSWKG